MPHAYGRVADLSADYPGLTDYQLQSALESATLEAEGPDAFGRTFQPYSAARTFRPPRPATPLYVPDYRTLTEVATGPGDGTFPDIWLATNYAPFPWDAPDDDKPYLAVAPINRYWPCSYPPAGPTVRVTATWGYSVELYDSGSSPGANMDAVQTVLPSGTGLSPGQTIRIDSEDLYVTAPLPGMAAPTPPAVYVRRGQNGTVAASHLAAAHIFLYRYPAAVAEAVKARAGASLSGSVGGTAGGVLVSETVGDITLRYSDPASSSGSTAAGGSGFSWSAYVSGLRRRERFA